MKTGKPNVMHKMLVTNKIAYTHTDSYMLCVPLATKLFNIHCNLACNSQASIVAALAPVPRTTQSIFSKVTDLLCNPLTDGHRNSTYFGTQILDGGSLQAKGYYSKACANICLAKKAPLSTVNMISLASATDA